MSAARIGASMMRKRACARPTDPSTKTPSSSAMADPADHAIEQQPIGRFTRPAHVASDAAHVHGKTRRGLFGQAKTTSPERNECDGQW
jgi:hypothetical protein